MKIRSLLFCSVLLAMGASCQRDTKDRLDEAAEEVADKRGDLADEREDLTEEQADVAHASTDLARAELDFATKRTQAVGIMRVKHGVYASQLHMSRALLNRFGADEGGLQAASDRILTFEREVNEAEMAIDSMATATADQWESAYDTAGNAFEQLEGARDDALGAIRRPAVDRDVDVDVDVDNRGTLRREVDTTMDRTDTTMKRIDERY
jgi:hypothetical protein